MVGRLQFLSLPLHTIMTKGNTSSPTSDRVLCSKGAAGVEDLVPIEGGSYSLRI